MLLGFCVCIDPADCLVAFAQSDRGLLGTVSDPLGPSSGPGAAIWATTSPPELFTGRHFSYWSTTQHRPFPIAGGDLRDTSRARF